MNVILSILVWTLEDVSTVLINFHASANLVRSLSWKLHRLLETLRFKVSLVSIVKIRLIDVNQVHALTEAYVILWLIVTNVNVHKAIRYEYSFEAICPSCISLFEQGSNCATMINHCTSNPCLHDGLCIPLLDAYRCVCLDDYIGFNCERTSDECISNPCLNNGTCVDQIWNYTCQCPSGFTGSHCQNAIDYCMSSPCIEGLCVNQVGLPNLCQWKSII